MPIHDWTRVDAGVFHRFHHEWIFAIARALKAGVLPPDQPLTLASYSSGLPKRAFVEPVAVGATLPDMPLFLEPDRYILTPLEATCADAFAAVPKRWREELEPTGA